jgi:hypothetical protein
MFFFLSLLFCKIGKQEEGTGPAQVGGLTPVGGQRWQGKMSKRVNMVQKCVHMHVNAKMIPVDIQETHLTDRNKHWLRVKG